MPFGLQPLHLIVIAIVALIIFGPKRLPEVGRGIGRALSEFRKGAQEMTEGFREEVVKPVNEAPLSAASAQSGPLPAQPVGSRFCSQCGAPNAAEAKFCNHCGAQLPA